MRFCSTAASVAVIVEDLILEGDPEWPVLMISSETRYLIPPLAPG